jgi:peptide deformylase
VAVPHGRDVVDLIEEMIDAMRFPTGVGLAANQIGEPWRVIIVQLREDEHPTAIINPEIYWRSPSREILGVEGCLSFKGTNVLVPRNRHVKVRGFDSNWNPLIYGGKNFRARCLQHEIDHLNGIGMTQRAVKPGAPPPPQLQGYPLGDILPDDPPGHEE